MNKPQWGLRVQAPPGARVLSFVCCAPNDGFSPQSRLVQRGILYAVAWGSENHTTALTGEMQSPFGGWRHHLARWEACHLILSRLRLLANQVPLPPGGKHVTGFAGRLQLPYESSSFATPAVRLVNQKEGPFMGRLRAYFDQLAHPMQDVHSGTITRAYCRAAYEERPRGVLFCPRLRGKSGAAG